VEESELVDEDTGVPELHATNRVQTDRPSDGGKCGRCGRPLLIGAPVLRTAANFDAHGCRSDISLLVDF
jgi:thioredoxin 2